MTPHSNTSRPAPRGFAFAASNRDFPRLPDLVLMLADGRFTRTNGGRHEVDFTPERLPDLERPQPRPGCALFAGARGQRAAPVQFGRLGVQHPSARGMIAIRKDAMLSGQSTSPAGAA